MRATAQKNRLRGVRDSFPKPAQVPALQPVGYKSTAETIWGASLDLRSYDKSALVLPDSFLGLPQSPFEQARTANFSIDIVTCSI